jgi:hypothetical protein
MVTRKEGFWCLINTVLFSVADISGLRQNCVCKIQYEFFNIMFVVTSEV